MSDKMIDTKLEIEKIILIAINNGDEKELEIYLKELEELVKTSGAIVVGTMIQKRDKPSNNTYFGKGKLEELKDYASLLSATGIVSDDELSSIQIKNISAFLDLKVMDRTMVILDIFAKRAFSREGKAQVELAQLKYNSSRLIGLGKSLSRQGGGIGTKGPGEKKLETDRRHIKDRISELEKEIVQIKIQRQTQRDQRIKKGIPIISMVGYTNAGKSTLMNLLTDANVLSEDKLFATLDTTTRKLKLPSSKEVLFTDTVGFIQKLPHTLIKAFNATLEELSFADILVHVVDVSSYYYKKQIETVYQTLKELNCFDKPIITVLNKTDLIDENIDLIFNDENAEATILLSAKTGYNIENFLNILEEVINKNKKVINLLIPFEDSNMISIIYNFSQIITEEYKENGIFLSIITDQNTENRLAKYII